MKHPRLDKKHCSKHFKKLWICKRLNFRNSIIIERMDMIERVTYRMTVFLLDICKNHIFPWGCIGSYFFVECFMVICNDLLNQSLWFYDHIVTNVTNLCELFEYYSYNFSLDYFFVISTKKSQIHTFYLIFWNI